MAEKVVRIVVVRSDRNLHRQRAYQKVSVFLNVQYVQNDCTRVRLSLVRILVCDGVCMRVRLSPEVLQSVTVCVRVSLVSIVVCSLPLCLSVCLCVCACLFMYV